jgi:hypothetical protein
MPRDGFTFALAGSTYPCREHVEMARDRRLNPRCEPYFEVPADSAEAGNATASENASWPQFKNTSQPLIMPRSLWFSGAMAWQGHQFVSLQSRYDAATCRRQLEAAFLFCLPDETIWKESPTSELCGSKPIQYRCRFRWNFNGNLTLNPVEMFT